MRRRGRLPVAEALSVLHAEGLVHRDVKPSNIIFVRGVPKLADVGLVSQLSADLSYVGTAGYVPVEGPGSVQSDIFALGKVLYEAATGLGPTEFPHLPESLADAPDVAAFGASGFSLTLGSRSFFFPDSADLTYQGSLDVASGEGIFISFDIQASGESTGFGDGPWTGGGTAVAVAGSADFELRILEDRLHWAGDQPSNITGDGNEWLENLPISDSRFAVFNQETPRNLSLTLDGDSEWRGLIVDGEELALDLGGHWLNFGTNGASRKEFSITLGEVRTSPSKLTLKNGTIETTNGIRLHSLPDNPVTLVLENGVEAKAGVSLKGLPGFPAELDIRGTGSRHVETQFGSLNEAGSGIRSAQVLDHATLKIGGGAVIGDASPRMFLPKIGATNGLAFVEIKDTGTSVGTDLSVGVGLDGNGLLHVLDGAHLSAVQINVGDTTSGSPQSGEGAVLVDGIDSRLSAQNLTISRGLFIRTTGGGTDATFSRGSVTVAGGGLLNATDVFVGETPFTEGTLTVTGTGSQAVVRNLSLGQQNNQFTIRPGEVVIGGPAATGRVEVRDGGLLRSTNKWETVNYPDADILHDLLVTGSGSRLDAETVGGATFFPANVAVKIADGGVANSNPMKFSGQGRFQVTDPGSAWDVNGAFELGFLGSPGHAEVLNGGMLAATNLNVGTVTADSTLRISGPGSVAVINGTVLAGLRSRAIANVTIGDTGGATTITVENGGGLIADEVFLGPTSTLTGAGGTIFADVFSVGFISPGSSPGSMTIDGDLNMNGGRIILEIGGTNPGTDHDQLFITGDFNMTNGVIDLVFINGFAPTAGQTFSVMNVDGESGFVPQVRAVNLAPDWQFETSFDLSGGAMTITSVTDGTFVAPNNLRLNGVTLLPMTANQDGGISGRIEGGPAGAVVGIESSSDLGKADPWKSFGSFVLDGNGSALITETVETGSAANPDKREKNFYRLRVE